VFTGGCTLAAAEAVCDAELDTLQALVDRSLLRIDRQRYSMLQVLHEYAHERLEEADEAGALRRRHATWFVQLAEAQPLFQSVPPHSPFAPESENFRSALEWANRRGDNETVARLAAPLTFLL